MTITKPQWDALRLIASVNDGGNAFNHRTSGVNRRILDRLRREGLITSAAPFAYRFHTVYVTEAGRSAVAETGGPA